MKVVVWVYIIYLFRFDASTNWSILLRPVLAYPVLIWPVIRDLFSVAYFNVLSANSENVNIAISM